MTYDGPERRRRWTRRETIDRLMTFAAVCLAAWAVFGVQDQSNETGDLTRENQQRLNENAALTRTVRHNAIVVTKALCGLRADVQRRVASGVVFLTKHPHGAFGFKPPEILKSIHDQRRTIDALSGLRCPPLR